MFSVDFRLQLCISRQKIYSTKTVFVNTARRVLKCFLCWLAQPLGRLLRFLLLLFETKKVGFAKFTFDVPFLDIVITKYGDFLVLLVQFTRFGKMPR